MTYNIKKIEEDDFLDFLLNPFERSAYFENVIIQKLERDGLVDDFISINHKNNHIFRVGFILYQKGEIIIERSYALNTDLIDEYPCIRTADLNEQLRQEIIDKVAVAKTNKLDQLKKLPNYAKVKDVLEDKYFKAMVFAKLGTTYNLQPVESELSNKISSFLYTIKDENILSIVLGETELLDAFVDEIISSSSFLAYEVVYPELIKQVDEYVAAGKFTSREQTLIDIMDKIRASGAKEFFVDNLSGLRYSCKNEIDQFGKMSSACGLFSVDIDAIKVITYKGKDIYKKSRY